MEARITRSAEETKAVGAELAAELGPGDVVLLQGQLGAGKTTLVRGLLEALGHQGPVRSPTFNLLQVFETEPPVLHADLYRLNDARGTGIEDYLDGHIILIEWPEAASSMIDFGAAWKVQLEFHPEGREIHISGPKS